MLQDRKVLTMLGALCLLGSFTSPSFRRSSQESAGPPWSTQRVVATRADKEKGQGAFQKIEVTKNRKVLIVKYDGAGVMGGAEELGEEVLLPAEFGFTNILPRDEVPVRLKSAHGPGGDWTMWVVLTAGFGEIPSVRDRGHFKPINTFYALRRDSSGERLLLKKPLINYYVDEFDVADVNGDGILEVALQYVEESAISPSTWLSLWQISPRGELQPISLENAEKGLNMRFVKKSYIGLGDFEHGDTRLYTEETVASDGGWTVRRKTYAWDAGARKYVLRRVQTTQE